MLPLSQRTSLQQTLFEVVYADDEILLKSPEAEWFRILYNFPWRLYQGAAAVYYDALHEFNVQEAQKGLGNQEQSEEEQESKEDAKQRCLFERPTMEEYHGKKIPALFQRVETGANPITVNTESLSPGNVPIRFAGRKPKCFFALFKSFLGTTLMGYPPEPKDVRRLLINNPNFAQVCGFYPKTEAEVYCHEHVPSLRKLEQFDQIMSENGIWGKIKQDDVRRNIESGLIKIEEDIVLDAQAVTDAASFDSKSALPHAVKVMEMYPEVQPIVKRFLYDSACDDADLKKEFKELLGIELKTSLNPRGKKTVVDGLPRGIEKLTPYGVPICEEGFEMDFKGVRYENEKFLYQAPKDSENLPVCLSCNQRDFCSPDSLNGRSITISFDLLSHIDPNDPPMAKRYKAIMTRRPSVERMIKRLKCDLSDDRLSKRGNVSFQAYLDKTMIAYHMLLKS